MQPILPVDSTLPTDTQVRLVHLDQWERVAELGPEWERLVERVPDASVYQTFQWHACWWRAFGAPHHLHVIACFRGDRLVGIAPLMLRMDAAGRSVEICLIGTPNYASDYADFLVDPAFPEVLARLLEETLRQLGPAHRLRLSQFPAHSANAGRIRTCLRDIGARFIEEPGLKAPTRILGDAVADRRLVNKASLRRACNALGQSGDLRYHRCVGEEEILQFMDTFFEQHVARRSHSRSPSQFLRPEQRDFFRHLVKELLPQGWLRFDALLLDGRAIAFHFGFEFRGRFFWYKPAFCTGEARRSPGLVLLKFILEDAIDRRLGEFDFTVGDEAFKYRFANLERHNLSFTVFRTRTAFWGHRGVLALKHVARSAMGLRDRVSRT
jgi:CelD/BcsL family acetyltransferase involved in cellulose biosynthesis